MAETLPDISIPTDQYVSINSLSGVAVGTAIDLLNKSTTFVRLIESATQPASDSKDGKILTTVYQPYAPISVKAGSLEIWAKSTGNTVNGVINVEVV